MPSRSARSTPLALAPVHLSRLAAVFVAAAAAALPAAATPPAGGRGDLILRDAVAATAPATVVTAGVLAREVVRIDPAVLASLPESLWLELAPGELLHALRTGSEAAADGGLVWRGRFAEDDHDYSSVTLSLHRGLLHATIETSAGPVYALRPLTGGGSELLTLDPAAAPACTAADDLAPGAGTGRGAAGPAATGAAAAEANGAPRIGILALYTQNLPTLLGGVGAVEAYAHSQVAVLNTTFGNSGVDGRAYLAGVRPWPRDSLSSTINRAVERAASNPEILALREQLGGDLVAILAELGTFPSSGCGVATVMTRGLRGPQMADRATSLSVYECNADGFVFVHEVGHNMGAQHDPGNATAPAGAAYDFSFGHGVDDAFRTIMAYPGACTGCRRVNLFSNPLRSLDGHATGIHDRRDNARTLSLTFPLVASFRAGEPPPGPPPAQRPAAPSQLSAQAVSATEVALAWIDNAGDETGFDVDGRAAGGAWQRLARLPADSVAHTAGDLLPGTAYRFRVRALGDGPPSAYSAQATATTPPAAPGVPQGLSAEPASSSEVTLRWVAAPDASAYEVEVRGADPAGDRPASPIAAAPEGARIGGLAAASPYTFRVRAMGPTGASEWSAPASTTTRGAPGAPCVADDATLCLLGDRFEVRAHWRNPRPPFGHGTALAKAASGAGGTGAFTFFDPDNVELVVKLIDGRSVNGAFWHFHGALSDVEYWVSVRDTASDAVRTYRNPPFALCGLGDTSAFAAPEDGADAASRAAAPVLVPLSAAPRRTAAGASAADGACTPGAETLCLAGGRFRVEVDWENPHLAGDRGVGRVFDGLGGAVSGHFWFFHPDSLDLAVKILDGRSINGHFWILWGGLSDVGYTLRVTDTESGESHDFVNPPLTLCGGAVTDLL